MSHQPWTQEQVEKWADLYVDETLCGEPINEDHCHSAFLAGLAKAAEMIEACPTMYGSHIGDPINRYWESTRASCDTHSAKLVGVRPIDSDERGSGR